MNNNENKVIQTVLEVVESNMDEKELLCIQLNDSLKDKYNKVNRNEEKYVELLKFNILYYRSIIKKMEGILDIWIKNGIITKNSSVTKNIENINESSLEYMNKAMKGGISALTEKDRTIYLGYDRLKGIKRVEKVESEYKVLNLYKDIVVNFLNEVSNNPQKYKTIVDLKVQDAKAILTSGIFLIIENILYTQDSEETSFKDEALVGEDDFNGNIEDRDNCLSFKKYVSMISNPEVLVRINDCFTKATEDENIEEEDAYLFSENMKDYISCVVLLMDYIPEEGRKYYNNLFRMFVIGKINESGFREYSERYIRDDVFLDSKTWSDCQNIVKSDFNSDNNKFIGSKKLDVEPSSDLSITQMMDFLKTFDKDVTIEEGLKSVFGSYEADDEENNNIKTKFFKGLSSFSDKLKVNSSSDDDYDEDYSYEDDYGDCDEEDYDYENPNSRGIMSKFKNMFKKHKDEYVEEEYENEEYEDDYEYNYDDIEIDPELFNGDSDIQDREAIEILKMREKVRRVEQEHTQKEMNDLKNERQLAEEISKNGGYPFMDEVDIEIEDEDLAYKKGYTTRFRIDTDNVFDNTIDGKNNSISVEDILKLEGKNSLENKDSIGKAVDKEDSLVEIKFEENKKEHTDELEKERDNASFDILDFTNNPSSGYKNSEKNKENDEEVNKNTSKKEKNRSITDYTGDKRNLYDDVIKDGEYNIFEELEAMKAMKTKNIKITPVSAKPDSKVDLSNFSKNKTSKTEVIEDGISANESVDAGENAESRFISLKDRLTNVTKGISGGDDAVYPKGKIARDMGIIIVLAIVVFFGYIFIIKGFKVPTVSETNTKVQIEANKKKKEKNENIANSTTDNNGQGATVSSNADAPNPATTEVAQKTDAEMAKEQAENKASQLDREADLYKNGNGVYYTVFVGATKSKDGAYSVANNFQRRGIYAKVVRNGGYYMLKVGSYPNYNQAFMESKKISAKGVQNYIASRNKYYDLKIEAFDTRAPYLTKDQLKTDYNDLRNQISSTGKSSQYIKNLDEVYNEALNGGN